MEPKWKHLAAVDLKSNHYALESSSNIAVDSDLHGKDDWIIVKKQRVNILIPCLPSIVQSPAPDLEQGQLRGNMSRNMTDILSELPLEKPSKACVADRNNRSMSWSPKSNTPSRTKVYTPAENAVAIPKPRKPFLRRLPSENQVGALRSFSEKTETLLKFHKTSPKLIRTSMTLPLVRNFSSSTTNFSRKMRASNLERNIASAGGLGRWLSSLGLEKLEGILCAHNVNKFQLADLSMKKLKDMGIHAVGPRRKLIHAIECVCQPYCYEPIKNLQNQSR